MPYHLPAPSHLPAPPRRVPAPPRRRAGLQRPRALAPPWYHRALALAQRRSLTPSHCRALTTPQRRAGRRQRPHQQRPASLVSASLAPGATRNCGNSRSARCSKSGRRRPDSRPRQTHRPGHPEVPAREQRRRQRRPRSSARARRARGRFRGRRRRRSARALSTSSRRPDLLARALQFHELWPGATPRLLRGPQRRRLLALARGPCRLTRKRARRLAWGGQARTSGGPSPAAQHWPRRTPRKALKARSG